MRITTKWNRTHRELKVVIPVAALFTVCLHPLTNRRRQSFNNRNFRFCRSQKLIDLLHVSHIYTFNLIMEELFKYVWIFTCQCWLLTSYKCQVWFVSWKNFQSFVIVYITCSISFFFKVEDTEENFLLLSSFHWWLVPQRGKNKSKFL